MRYIIRVALRVVYRLKEITYVEKCTRDMCLHCMSFLYSVKLICGKISRVLV